MCPTRCDHLAAALGRHAGTETVTALAHQLARLIGPFHVAVSALCRYRRTRRARRSPWPQSARNGVENRAAYKEATLFRQLRGCLAAASERMNINTGPSSSRIAPARRLFSLRRLAPLIAISVVSIVLIAAGWHRELSLEMLARHHYALREFIAAHRALAVATYVALYIAVVTLSLPVGAYLTVIGGILFGALLGGAAAVVGASVGAILIFLIARSAFGEHLARRAGPTAEKIAAGFRRDAFSYLLFLRLVPVFPFWLVNLVSAASGLRLAPFAAATVLGILPATFAFALVGSGLEKVIEAQEVAQRACSAAARPDCPLMYPTPDVLTPQVLAALAALGVLALVPVLVKRLRGRHAAMLASRTSEPELAPASKEPGPATGG
jgi:uncharacterized membrane protein YdjX (TVP38/TMEM64 family)